MKEFHPIVNFMFFVLIIIFSMFFMHPIFLIISLSTSIIYLFKLKGKRALKQVFAMFIIMMIFIIINPFISHSGATILVYINNNPITLEAIIYGVASCAMLISVITWFSAYNEIMTSDKFIYLFGRIIPKTSLIFSMILRFVPRFKMQLKVINQGQRSIHKSASDGNILNKIIHGINILSILVTMSLENSIETSDSMRARGYGLEGRTNFSIFKIQKRDKIAIIVLIILGLIVIGGGFIGANNILYYPLITINPLTIKNILVYVAYLILSIFPIILDIMESRNGNN